jgi:hypothetical protein
MTDRRKCPNLQPVIDWLERGCDPIEAAKELRIYQAMMTRDAERADAVEPRGRDDERNE